MDNLQIASPVTPAAGNQPAATDVADEGAAQPWVAAFQAAMTLAKGVKPLAVVPGAPVADPADPSAAAATDADDEQLIAADTTLVADPAGLPLPLLATLPPMLPATPALTPSPAPATATSEDSDAQRAINTGLPALPATALSMQASAVAESRTAAEPTAPKAQAATEKATNADAVTRAIELATARDSRGRETVAQPQVTFAPAQPAPVATAPAAPQAQLQINSAVGSPAWGPELGQKVVWMVGEKQHVAELHVNPPDLGPLDIKLTISEHQTTAVFTSPHGAVRDAVESALPRLREVLAESGIMLGNASVTADSPRDGSAFATPQDQARRGGTHSGTPDTPATATQLTTVMPVRRNGLVDLFA